MGLPWLLGTGAVMGFPSGMDFWGRGAMSFLQTRRVDSAQYIHKLSKRRNL